MSKLKNLVSATKNIGTNLNGVKTGAKILTDKNSIFTKEVGKQILGEAGKEVGKGLVLPGAAVAGVGAVGAGIKALSKKKEKTAFDIVNDSFDKIAKDEPSTKGLRKNVTVRALGAGATGGFLGGHLGQTAAFFSGKSPVKGAKVGAAIGAGLNATESIIRNVRHNRKIDAIENNLKNKTAFDVVTDSFEKIAERMPFTLANGDYAIPRGWEAAYGADNDDVDGTWENDYYRKQENIPTNLKRIADNGAGDSMFVDTNSDKNNPLYHGYYHDAGLYEVDDNYRDDMFSPIQLENKNFGSLKEKGLNTTQGINGLTPDQLREFGYAEPTFKDKAKSFGRMAKKSAKVMGAGALLGAGLLGVDNPTSLKGAGKQALVGAGIGAGMGAGFNHLIGGFKMDDTAKARQEKVKRSLRNDLYDDSDNETFTKQYKTANELVNDVFANIGK